MNLEQTLRPSPENIEVGDHIIIKNRKGKTKIKEIPITFVGEDKLDAGGIPYSYDDVIVKTKKGIYLYGRNAKKF